MHVALIPILSALLLAGTAPGTPTQDEVTIYRCTDAQGRLALQDFPCAQGEQQQVRTMVRPQDPPPEPAGAAPAAPAAVAPEPAAIDVAVHAPPRPMYECITPDGERYTSDRGDGNPRPAPVWGWGGGWTAPGAPPGPRNSSERRAAGIASPGMTTSPGPSLTRPASTPAAPPPPPGRPDPHYPLYGHAAGMIRDECHQLPHSRVCNLLSDRRTTIRRRMFNAQPSERAELREEERDITARLNDDCNIR